jgi:DNA-binding NarL/FixJ family response regulator
MSADGFRWSPRHRANILEKLGMRDRVDITRYAIRRGLVEP